MEDACNGCSPFHIILLENSFILHYYPCVFAIIAEIRAIMHCFAM